MHVFDETTNYSTAIQLMISTSEGIHDGLQFYTVLNFIWTEKSLRIFD